MKNLKFLYKQAIILHKLKFYKQNLQFVDNFIIYLNLYQTYLNYQKNNIARIFKN